MIINGTLKSIRVERTRNLIVHSIELPCPDYRLEGDFPPYKRLADFLWHIISTQVIAAKQPDFLTNTAMLPASLTALAENAAGEQQYLLVCMDCDLTTTYHVHFSMDQEIFRRSWNGFLINDLDAKVTYNGITHEYQITDVTTQSWNAYWELSGACWTMVDACIMILFDSTDEEDDAMYYLAPKDLPKSDLLIRLEQNGEYCRLTGSLPDGSYHAEATFTMQEKLD